MDLDDVEANPSHPQSSPQQPGRSMPGVSVEIDNTHGIDVFLLGALDMADVLCIPPLPIAAS
jgi:hypothetical protein